MVSPIMGNPFSGLMEGAQAYQGLMDAYRAPQLQQLQLLQEQAKLQQMQGLDPVSQSQIEAREAQTGLAQREEGRLNQEQERRSQEQRAMMLSGIAGVARGMDSMEERMSYRDHVSQALGMEIPDESLTDESLDNTIKTGEALRMVAGDQIQARAQKIYANGTTVQSTDKGLRVFVPGKGQLKGDAASAAISKAQKNEAEQERQKGLAKSTAQQSIEISGQAFEKLPSIGKNISSLDKAVELVRDKEAGVGPIMSLLPSITDASIELDNLKSQLGLDVVSLTTFGALSEGELKMALDTALPTKLRGPALTKWLEEKKAAQSKLYKELQSVATFFSRGGNIAEYLQMKEDLGANLKQSAEVKKSEPGSLESRRDALREELGL